MSEQMEPKEPGLPAAAPLSLTQQRDLPVKSLPAAADGLSHTQARDLPQRELSVTDTPRGRGDTDGDRDAPDGGLGLKPGDTLAQRYEIRALIGRGGMGAVFATFDRVRNEEVAVKVLLPHLLKDPQARERFTNEAKIASSLSHPNIVRVFDLQEDGANSFLTMELLQGTSLREEITKRQAKSQRFTVDEVRRIGEQLCDAFSHAHKLTIHRDVKPENIWLCEDGTLKLMDFGIARLLRPSQFTSLGLGMGTAYYMAPEQLKAQKEIDHRADQYAVGVVLYELLTGDIPQGVIRAPHEIRKNVPTGLSQAIMKSLAGSPAERFSDMASFGAGLRSHRIGFKAPRWAAVAAIVAVLVLGGGTAPFWLGPAKDQFKIYLAGAARSQAATARTRAEQARKTWQAKSSGLAAEHLPAQAADAEAKWNSGEAALARLKFAAAATEFAAVEYLLTEAERVLQQNRERINLAQAARDKMETVAQAWNKIAANLPICLQPVEATPAQTSREEAETALGGKDYEVATNRYDAATRAYIAARDLGEPTQKLCLAAETQLKLLAARRAAWQELAKGLAGTQVPAAASQAESTFGLAQASAERPETLALASSQAVEAHKLFEAAMAAVNRERVAELAVAESRADTAFREAQGLLEEMKRAINEAERTLARVQLQKKPEEVRQAEADLAAGKRLLAAYEKHPLCAAWHDAASGGLAAGKALAREDALSAREKYLEAESAAKKLVLWLKHAPESLAEISRLQSLVVARLKTQSDPAADLCAWPKGLLNQAHAKFQEADPRAALAEARQVEASLPQFDAALQQRPAANVGSQGTGRLPADFEQVVAKVAAGDKELRGGNIAQAERFYAEARKLCPMLVAPFEKVEAQTKQKQWADFQGRQVVETNSIGMKLAIIPPGEFVMGSPVGETDRGSDEKQHTVRITKPFSLGIYEVTQNQFSQVLGRNPSKFRDGADLPVESVNWYEAVEFCNALSEKEGLSPYYVLDSVKREKGAITAAMVTIRGEQGYRLPTEAEWEYACRAGTTSVSHFGNALNGREANTNGNIPYGTSIKGPFLGKVTFVGSYAANSFGLYDMHGNVGEWCNDWYGEYGADAVDPKGLDSGVFRVIRGGNWLIWASACRSAHRYRDWPSGGHEGFRVVCVP